MLINSKKFSTLDIQNNPQRTKISLPWAFHAKTFELFEAKLYIRKKNSSNNEKIYWNQS